MQLERLASIFEEVRIAPLRPDDLLVFRANATLSLEQKVELYDAIGVATGHPRVLILDGGAELAIIRPEPYPDEAPAAPPPIHRPIAGPAAPAPVAGEKRGTAPGAIS